MVSAIDTRHHEVIKYLPVNGAGAKTIARRPLVSEEGKREIVYVANYFSDDISILDITNLRADGHMDGRGHFVKKLSLSSRYADPRRRGYKIAPRGMAFTPDGKFAIVLATETGSILVIDSVQHHVIAELAPISRSTLGRFVNVRHIVLTKDGKTAYLSHMKGNAVSRFDVSKLIQLAQASGGHLPDSTWNQLLLPFPNGKKLLVLEDYPSDHPNFPNRQWPLAHPNTIVLDPVKNRYLYVSHRTTSNQNYEIIDPRIKGKIDVIDTFTGEVVFSLTGGAQPTALEVTPDNSILISGGFKDNKLYFFDLRKLLELYEK